MALIWFDGFENYSNKTQLENVDSIPHYAFIDNPTFSSSYGREGRGMQCNDQIEGVYMTDLGVNMSTVIFGFAWKRITALDAQYQNNTPMVRFDMAGYSTKQLKFHFMPDWKMRIYDGNNNYIGQTWSAISTAGWQYIEIKAYMHQSAGTIEIRFNTQTVYSVSGIDTSYSGNAWVRAIFLGSVNYGTYSNIQSYYDDMYVCDGTGSECNDFLGDVRIDVIRPNGAGSSTQLTPSAGSNYQNVDETVPDDDTTYNHSDIVGYKDLYAMGNISALGTNIYGLKTQTTVRKTDATGRYVKPVLKSGSTEVDGTEIALSTSYRTFAEMYQDDPDTSDAWLEADVNAVEAGVKVTV